MQNYSVCPHCGGETPRENLNCIYCGNTLPHTLGVFSGMRYGAKGYVWLAIAAAVIAAFLACLLL